MTAIALGGFAIGVGFPTLANTGYSGTLTAAGSNTISTPGTYSLLHFTGPVTISASNVTLSNCWIDCTGETNTNSTYFNFGGAVTGFNMSYCTLTGPGSATTQPDDTDGIVVNQVISGTIDHCQIIQCGHCIHFDGTSGACNLTITNCYMGQMASGASAHYECIYYGGNGVGGGNPAILIQHNTLDMTGLTQTAAIWCGLDNGPIQGLTIDKNLLGNPGLGGPLNYDLVFDQEGVSQNIIVTVTNNAMYSTLNSSGGQHYSDQNNNAGGTFAITWSGNYDAVTQAAVTN